MSLLMLFSTSVSYQINGSDWYGNVDSLLQLRREEEKRQPGNFADIHLLCRWVIWRARDVVLQLKTHGCLPWQKHDPDCNRPSSVKYSRPLGTAERPFRTRRWLFFCFWNFVIGGGGVQAWTSSTFNFSDRTVACLLADESRPYMKFDPLFL